MKRKFQTTSITKYIFHFVLTFLCSYHLHAQTYVNESWQSQDGQPDLNVKWSETIINNAGDILVVGNTIHSTQAANIYLVKYDEGGNKLWERQYNGSSSLNDYGTAVAVDSADNIYIAGATFNISDGFDYVVVKYDNQGNLLWTYTYDGYGEDDIPADIQIASNGDVILTGMGTVTGNQSDFLTMLLDNNSGSQLWKSYYDYANLEDGAVKVEQFGSNNFVVTGASQASTTNYEAAIVTYDQNGVQLGVEREGGVTIQQVKALETDNNGNFYITGAADNANGNLDFKTVKLDQNLNVIWSKIYDEASGDDVANDLVIDNTNHIYITGEITTSTGQKATKTIKYDAQGTIVWERTFSDESSANISGVSIALNDNDELGVTALLNDGGDKSLVTIGYATDGSSKWNRLFTINDQETPLQIESNGSDWVVTGISAGASSDYFVLSYSTFDRVKDMKYDVNGIPEYEKNVVLVSFYSGEMNTSNLDAEQNEFSDLSYFLSQTAYDDIEDQLSELVDLKEVVAIRMMPSLKTTQTYTYSRTGRKEAIPHFWSSLSLHLPTSVDEQQIISALENSDYVNYANFNSFMQASSTPNDGWYGSQQSIYKSNINGGINILGAWDIATGKEYVKVGVVDAGINYLHEDFQFNGASRVVGGYHYYNKHPYDVTNNGNQYIYDASSHGTKVAGIIGATRDNSLGVAGIAGGGHGLGNGVSLYNIAIGTVSGNNISLSVSEAYRGIIEASLADGVSSGFATDKAFGQGFGIQILNHSYGKIYNSDSFLEEGIRFAYWSDLINIAARGNTYANQTSAPQYPACLEDHIILNVGGSNENAEHWNIGSDGSAIGHNIDVVAPAQETSSTTGSFILSTATDFQNALNGYLSFGATSAATAHVSGLAALILSYINQEGCASNLAQEDVEYLIENNTMDITTAPAIQGYDDYTGHGLINAEATLEAIEMPKYRIKHFDTEWTLADIQNNGTEESGWTNRFFNGAKGAFDGISIGTHATKYYKITMTIPISLGANESEIESWLRLSGTSLYPSIVGALGNIYNLRGVESHSIDVANGVASITGYVYKVEESPGNYKWFPTQLNNGLGLTAGISVYSEDSQASSYSYPCNPISSVYEALRLNNISLYPNPVVGESTGLKYSLSSYSKVSVDIYDLSGRLISNVFKGNQPTGVSYLSVPVDKLSSGVYLIAITINGRSETLKLIRTKN